MSNPEPHPVSSPSKAVDVLAQISLTPEQVAEFFWRLDNRQQADFFAALERMAGVNLSFQMVGVVHELTERSERGDYDALHGFRTMFAHADDYPEAAASWRAARAKAALSTIGD